MDETLLSKAAFSEICKIMKHKDGAVRECIHSIIQLSLLLFPGLMCKDFASAAALEAGLLNVDVKNVADNAINAVKTAFEHGKSDFTSRAQDAQIAHILIVFAAYFEAIKKYLPDANRAIELSNKEKFTLTRDSLEDYAEFLKNQSVQNLSEEGFEIANFLLFMPNPVEGVDSSIKRLEKFYTLLNSRFLSFVEQLSYLESIPGHKKDYFYATIRAIPKSAVVCYKSLYYELSALFPDFFIWTTQEEHAKIQHSIDVGFSNISTKFDNIAEAISASTSHRALNILHREYISYINQPVVSKEEMPLGEHDIRLPNREVCFIPQAFRTLIYRENTTLDHTDKWISRKEIGKFLADTLRSPELGTKPVIILGDPGSGKTMLCHMLAAKILCREYYVIILHLRNLITDGEIYEQINQELEQRLQGMPCVWGDIVSSNPNKPILLIFDGYDELLQASGKTHSNYLERIAQFQERAMNLYEVTVRAIVTSRVVLIDKAQIPKESTVVLLDEFDDERIDLWCSIWNKHNAEYFSDRCLQPFSVLPSSKAYELARQPLLLLMLALFDSNGNALYKYKDLSATQLYNSLIRDFIEREQKKNPSFNQSTRDICQNLVNQEMERISIAALGMYNRNELHIRSCQLQEDLRLLSSVSETADLQDSEKLFGSFFFVHRSDSVDNIGLGPVVSSTYEFLHNTFGEFLTAHYIVMQTYDLLCDLLNCHQEQRSQTMTGRYKWYACMSYAPMFHRPVVAEMISSWAPLYFQYKGLSRENTLMAINLLIDFELPRILRGEVLAELNATQTIFHSRDSYPDLDPLTHMAIYSNNLVNLASLICGGLPLELLEKYDSQTWSKLRHIWRYSFSEDDLAEFAACFHIKRHENQRFLESRLSEVNKRKLLLSTPNRAKKLFETQVAMDEELEYTALGTLFDFDFQTVINGLQYQDIPKKAWLTVRYFAEQVAISRPTEHMPALNILDKIFLHGLEEHDESSLFYGLLLLKFLTSQDYIFLSDCFEVHQYTNPGWLCNMYRQVNQTKKDGKRYYADKPLGLLILQILNQIPLNVDTCAIICRELFPYKFRRSLYLESELFHVARLGQRIVAVYIDDQGSIPLHLFDSYIISITDTYEMVYRSQSRPIPEYIVREVLKTTVALMRYCEDENIYHLLMAYRDNVQHFSGHENFIINIEQASILIHALQLYHKGEADGSRLATELIPYIIGGGIQIVDIYDCDPSAVVDLIQLAQLFPHDIGLPLLPMFISLINKRGEQLTYGICRKLLEMSNSFSCKELYDAVVRNFDQF